MHAPSADLAGFALQNGVRPAEVYDVQLAAGFAGLGGSLSLERVLDQSLGVKLHHAEEFTDWARRPLSTPRSSTPPTTCATCWPQPTSWARRLEQQGRSRWAAEEGAALRPRRGAGAGA